MTTHASVRGRGVRLAGFVAAVVTSTAISQTGSATAQDGAVSVSSSSQRVVYGQTVELHGRVASRALVVLHYAPRGKRFHVVKRKRAGGHGRYVLRFRPVRSGRVRVATAGATASASRVRPVTVLARIAAHRREHVKAGRRAVVTGRLRPGFAHRRVRVQIRKRGRWSTVDRTRTRRGGRFKAAWRVRRGAGVYRTRVVFRGDRRNARRVRRTRLFVYRPGQASYYGPGLYGNRTACGQTLTPGTLGVANRWLPCGTRVTFRYHGRSVTVPVIDRGPFHSTRIWDLTTATKHRLGFGDIGVVWSTR